jgi:hypothetical protein
MSKGKKKKRDDEDEPVTYINDRNKVFNKKVNPPRRFLQIFTVLMRSISDRPVL